MWRNEALNSVWYSTVVDNSTAGPPLVVFGVMRERFQSQKRFSLPSFV